MGRCAVFSETPSSGDCDLQWSRSRRPGDSDLWPKPSGPGDDASRLARAISCTACWYPGCLPREAGSHHI